ncbi:MAG: SDR family oxidoreductase [Deltaproteobacteria bacterium]|nr:SDR family oxidoreductase [Deltaproteobacteria bacterium]
MAISNFSLNGKVAIITGGKRGIGKGIALTFAEAGADVVVCGRTLAELEKVADEIKALGRRSLAVKTDVSSKREVESLVEQTVEEFGTLDILVNNAVVYTGGTLVELSEENWDNTVDIGLKGFYLCSQAAAKVMIEKKQGCIINMSSTAGIRPTGRQGAYSVIKAAGIMVTKLLAVELADYNIRVNALAPTVVKTELVNPDLLKGFMTQLPLGRLTELDELTSAALFLASDAASYISGHTLIVDGGRINTFPRPAAV